VERLRLVDSRLAIKHQKLHEEQQSEINRLLLACETMQEQGRQYQESNAALQAKLDNAIDTAFDLEAENARLRKVVEAARGVFLGEGEHLCSEFEDAMDQLGQALSELDEADQKARLGQPGQAGLR
jgi:hypothetical protein